MSTVIHDAHRGNGERNQRWDRLQRADLIEQWRGLQAQGVSQRQAAQVFDVPRSWLGSEVMSPPPRPRRTGRATRAAPSSSS